MTASVRQLWWLWPGVVHCLHQARPRRSPFLFTDPWALAHFAQGWRALCHVAGMGLGESMHKWKGTKSRAYMVGSEPVTTKSESSLNNSKVHAKNGLLNVGDCCGDQVPRCSTEQSRSGLSGQLS